MLPSWLFRALLWPFWQLGGVHGLFAWRWLTTLTAFGLMLVAARRMGATGVAPLLMLLWCVLFWRQRSQMRPETFAGVLLAAEILLLETRRQWAGRDGAHARDLAWGLIPIAILWANAHISYYLGFIISGGYCLDDLLRASSRPPPRRARARHASRRRSRASPTRSAGTRWCSRSTTSPSGATSRCISPSASWRRFIGMFTSATGSSRGSHSWWGARLLRWRRRGFDAAQCVLLLVCLPQALSTQRFLGYAALTLAPFAARDFGDLLSRWSWPVALRAPAPRALLVSFACVVLVIPTLTATVAGFGYGWIHTPYPERACDWMEQHGVRGKSFNVFSFGGYMLWRFYPDPGRLPFMDIHQAGTKEIRYLYAWSLQDSSAWRELDKRFRPDYVLLPRVLGGAPNLIDLLDADSTWALTFADDAAALWLRRDGSCAALARSEAYRWLPGGARAAGVLGERVASDTTLRAPVRAEFVRAIRSSPWNARAHALAGNLDLLEGHFVAARAHYDEAVRVLPFEPGLHERLGLAEIYAGAPAAALPAFRSERELRPGWPEADLREGQAFAAMGDSKRARAAYERSLAKHPEFSEARDSLASLTSR